MLIKILYVVSSEDHFGSMREREREREYLAKLLGLSTRGGWELISRGVRGIGELGWCEPQSTRFKTQQTLLE